MQASSKHRGSKCPPGRRGVASRARARPADHRQVAPATPSWQFPWVRPSAVTKTVDEQGRHQAHQDGRGVCFISGTFSGEHAQGVTTVLAKKRFEQRSYGKGAIKGEEPLKDTRLLTKPSSCPSLHL